MKKALVALSICGLLALVVILGIRDIRRTRERLAAAPAAGSENGVTTIRFVKNPEPAPAVTLRALDGRTLSSSDWKGKVVLLNFWATWCPPCREEIPDLIKLQAKYDGQLQIVGLTDEAGEEEKVKSFAKQAGINYPIVISSPELEGKFGGVMGLPTSFLLDTQGRVVQKHVGLRNPVLYDTEIRALLGLSIEAKVETVEDTGQVFLRNAGKATALPGVDLSKLTPEQKKTVLRRLNEEKCTCGCGLTLAQCRVNDTSCDISAKLAKERVQSVAQGKS